MKQTSTLTRSLTVAQEAHYQQETIHEQADIRYRATLRDNAQERSTARYRDELGVEPMLKASEPLSTPVVYRLYTEDKLNLLDLIARYFDGATVINAIGIWQRSTELSKVIEIVGTLADLQNIVHLAGDIRHVNGQSSVLVTWQRLGGRLDITEQAVTL